MPDIMLLHPSNDNSDASIVTYPDGFKGQKESPEAELAMLSLGWDFGYFAGGKGWLVGGAGNLESN